MRSELHQLRTVLKGNGSKVFTVAECIVANRRNRSGNDNGRNGRISERIVADFGHRRRNDNRRNLGEAERIRLDLCRAFRKNDLRNAAHAVQRISAENRSFRNSQNALETAGKRDDLGNAAGNLYQSADVNAVLGVACLHIEGGEAAASGKDIFGNGGRCLRNGNALQSGVEERVRTDFGKRCGQRHGFECFCSAESAVADRGNLVERNVLQCAVIAESIVRKRFDAIRKRNGSQSRAAFKHARTERQRCGSGCEVNGRQVRASVECIAVNLGGSLRDGHRRNCGVLERVRPNDKRSGGVDGHCLESGAVQETGVTDSRYRCRDVDGFQRLAALENVSADHFQLALELYALQALAVEELLSAGAYIGGIGRTVAELCEACGQDNRFQSAFGKAAFSDLGHLRILAEVDRLKSSAALEALCTDHGYGIRNVDGFQCRATLEHLFCKEGGLRAEGHARQVDAIHEQSIGRGYIRRFHRGKGGHTLREGNAHNAGCLEGGRADRSQRRSFLKDNRLQRSAVLKIVVAERGNALRNGKGFDQRAVCDQRSTEGLDLRPRFEREGDKRGVARERIVSDGSHGLRNLNRREALILERNVADGLERRRTVRFFLKGHGSKLPFVFSGFKRIVSDRLNRCGNRHASERRVAERVLTDACNAVRNHNRFQRRALIEHVVRDHRNVRRKRHILQSRAAPEQACSVRIILRQLAGSVGRVLEDHSLQKHTAFKRIVPDGLHRARDHDLGDSELPLEHVVSDGSDAFGNHVLAGRKLSADVLIGSAV